MMRKGWLSAVVAVAAVVSVAAPAVAVEPSAAPTQAGKHHLSKVDLERRTKSSPRASNISEHAGVIIVMFDDRIEFHIPASGISLGPKGFTDGQRTLNPLELKPAQIVWFARPFDVQVAGRNILACTNQLLSRVTSTGLDNFCGIISNTGSILFQFPVKQHVPDTLAGIVGMNEDGTYGEIFVGRKVGGGDGSMAGVPREILAWSYPKQLSRIPGPYDSNGKPRRPGAETGDILQDFKSRAKQH